LTWVKPPAIHSCPFASRRSLTCPEIAPALKLVTTLPSLTRTLARLETETPPIELKDPPTKTVCPSPVGRTTLTVPFAFGTKELLITPLVASNARRRDRAMAVLLELF